MAARKKNAARRRLIIDLAPPKRYYGKLPPPANKYAVDQDPREEGRFDKPFFWEVRDCSYKAGEWLKATGVYPLAPMKKILDKYWKEGYFNKFVGEIPQTSPAADHLGLFIAHIAGRQYWDLVNTGRSPPVTRYGASLWKALAVFADEAGEDRDEKDPTEDEYFKYLAKYAKGSSGIDYYRRLYRKREQFWGSRRPGKR